VRVQVLKIKFLKAKNVYVLNKLPFQSLDAIMQHISRAPIKVRKKLRRRRLRACARWRSGAPHDVE